MIALILILFQASNILHSYVQQTTSVTNHVRTIIYLFIYFSENIMSPAEQVRVKIRELTNILILLLYISD